MSEDDLKKIEDLMNLMFEKEASDLHIVAGSPPVLRINGELHRVGDDKLDEQQCKSLIYSLLSDRQLEKFEIKSELDLSFGVKDSGRVRMNVARQRGSVCAAFRAIPNKILNFKELGIPKVIYKIVELSSGLVLVTGPTGSGKSTTLASVINYLNENRGVHIITIEDPIEYVHEHKKSIVRQRELGVDTNSFPEALKYTMRQDPDIIMIGEMRDQETTEAALAIAETGHLVFATLHTPDATQSVNRIIDLYPPYQHSQVISQLSMVLQAVLCQRLYKKRDTDTHLSLAVEILIVTQAVRNMIREKKTEQIYSVIETGSAYGMQTMEQSLYGDAKPKVFKSQ